MVICFHCYFLVTIICKASVYLIQAYVVCVCLSFKLVFKLIPWVSSPWLKHFLNMKVNYFMSYILVPDLPKQPLDAIKQSTSAADTDAEAHYMVRHIICV